MLRHQAIAVALFLSAGATGCEMAAAPTPEKPATSTPAPTETATATPPATAAKAEPTPAAPAEPVVERQFMTRAGPHWNKEKPRFKLVMPASTPPDAGTPAPSK
jgi:hypothetical protein